MNLSETLTDSVGVVHIKVDDQWEEWQLVNGEFVRMFDWLEKPF